MRSLIYTLFVSFLATAQGSAVLRSGRASRQRSLEISGARCRDAHCGTCVEDSRNPEDLQCTACVAGFVLEFAHEECSQRPGCKNQCKPCKDASCKPVLVKPKAHPKSKVLSLLPSVIGHDYSTTSLLIGAGVYVVLIAISAYGYMAYIKNYGSPLVASGVLPEDGFSDAIFSCSSDWRICAFACFCPCLRWSDTARQMGYMNFYLGVTIWSCLLLTNALLAGAGFVVIVLMGAWYRVKTRDTFGLPRAYSTVCQDIIAWFCCLPCAIAQEARHVERSLSVSKLKPQDTSPPGSAHSNQGGR